MRFMGGIRLGRIAGIEIGLDWSLLIIFVLITSSLAVGVFPAWHPEWTAALNWSVALGAAVLFFASVLTHELSHALVGRSFGMKIERITLFIFGGMAHLEDEPPTWRVELLMALAGPLTSLVLGMVFIWTGGFLTGERMVQQAQSPEELLQSVGPFATLLLWLGPINILLAVFNLVPGFPLDGGRALRAVLWGITGNLRRATRWAARGGQAFAWLLIAAGVAMILGMPVPVFGTGIVGGLWLAFIGWFLHSAALASYRQLLVRESLEDVPVRRLMQRQVTTISPGTSLATFADSDEMQSGQRAFPVVRGGRLVGLLSVSDMRKRPRGEWQQAQVHEVMTPVEKLVMVEPEQDAFEALELLGSRNLNQLPVVKDWQVAGLIRREDLLRWLTLHRDDVEIDA